MIFDYATQVSTAQAVTGNGTSANYFRTDLGGSSVGGLLFGVCVDESFVGAGSVDFAIESSATSDFASTRIDGAVYGLKAADLTKGVTVPIQLRGGEPFEGERYVRAKWTVSGDSFRAGKVTIAMVDAVNIGDGARFTAGASAVRF